MLCGDVAVNARSKLVVRFCYRPTLCGMLCST